MSKRIVAANWKMYLSEIQISQFFDEFLAGLRVEWMEEHEVVILPQAIHLGLVRERVKERLGWGVQNVYMKDEGAFTGETSPWSAAQFGAQYALIGHSERRQIFGETDEAVAEKVVAVQKQGMKAILCVGETLAERDSGQTMGVIERQLKIALSKCEKFSGVIAYEPVWAIGTGKNATPEQAQEVHKAIRNQVPGVSILYGGSVKPANAGALIAMPDIDGFLVGGASLKPNDFLQILEQTFNA